MYDEIHQSNTVWVTLQSLRNLLHVTSEKCMACCAVEGIHNSSRVYRIICKKIPSWLRCAIWDFRLWIFDRDIVPFACSCTTFLLTPHVDLRNIIVSHTMATFNLTQHNSVNGADCVYHHSWEIYAIIVCSTLGFPHMKLCKFWRKNLRAYNTSQPISYHVGGQLSGAVFWVLGDQIEFPESKKERLGIYYTNYITKMYNSWIRSGVYM